MRDYARFPDDANGDVLFDMVQEGDNLNQARDIDFAVVFSIRSAGEAFADACGDLGATMEMEEYEEAEDDITWTVIVTKHMLPTHSAITAFETVLEQRADRFGGRNDGWGCISQ